MLPNPHGWCLSGPWRLVAHVYCIFCDCLISQRDVQSLKDDALALAPMASTHIMHTYHGGHCGRCGPQDSLSPKGKEQSWLAASALKRFK